MALESGARANRRKAVVIVARAQKATPWNRDAEHEYHRRPGAPLFEYLGGAAGASSSEAACGWMFVVRRAVPLNTVFPGSR